MDEIDLSKFATLIKRKRGKTGLREAAEEIGDISPSTLSRLEHRNMPDVETFFRVCRWLGMPLEAFIVGAENGDNSVEYCRRKVILSHIYADITLHPLNAKSLAVMVDLAYGQKTTETP